MNNSEIKPYKPQYVYMGIALAGVYASSPTKFSKHSTTTSSTTIPDNRLSPYYGELLEGGIVMDKRTCKDEDIINMVCNGPMLNIDLPPQSKIVGFDGEILPCTDAKECKGLDYVSMDLYLALWRSLGAKIGERRGHLIQWENGHTEDIPSVEKRFEESE